MSDEAKDKASIEKALDTKEERHRLVALLSAIPLCLFCAIPLSPARRNRTLFEDAARDPTALAFMLLVFVWPLVIGIAAFWRAYKHKEPSKLLYGIPGSALALLSFLCSGGLIAALIANRGASEMPVVWLILGSTVAAFAIALKGFFRSGFMRLNHLIASAWFLGLAALLTLLAYPARSIFRQTPPALWIYCASIAMLLPLQGYVFWPRKGEKRTTDKGAIHPLDPGPA